MPESDGWYGRVKRQWARASKELAGTSAFWERSAAGVQLKRDLNSLVATHARGRVLDVGAGTLTYRTILLPHVLEYRSVDLARTHPDLDLVGDAQALPLPDSSFDTIFCAEVLEHVPDPERALREFHRVLVPGGKLLLSVPHLGYLHNEPNDFFRYTRHGVRVLLERAGFRVITVAPSGGLWSFLQHIGATIAVGFTYGVPLLWPLAYQLCRLTGRGAVFLDAHTDRRKLFALHYVAAGAKN